jgi:hypothetical protein
MLRRRWFMANVISINGSIYPTRLARTDYPIRVFPWGGSIPFSPHFTARQLGDLEGASSSAN